MARRRCLYCGGEPVAATEDAPLTCPGCRLTMAKITVGATTIDRCERCGSTWYDRGELEAMIESGESPEARGPGAPKPAAAGSLPPGPLYVPCLRCQSQMTRQVYQQISGVVIHVCGLHGMFLRAGDLARIQEFYAQGGARRVEERRRVEAERMRESREEPPRPMVGLRSVLGVGALTALSLDVEDLFP